MRKWLYILLALAVARALFQWKGAPVHRSFSFFDRLGRIINIFIWVLCSFYLLAVLYWFLYPEGR